MTLKKFPRLPLLIVLLLIFQSITACAPNIAELQNQGEIDQLITALDYKFASEIRADAIQALREIGAPAVEKLLATYHERDPQKRENIELALREISHRAMSDLLQEAKEVCANTAMVGAGAYQPSVKDPNPLIYVNEGDPIFDAVTQNLNLLPVDWLPYQRADVQAVVCLHSDKDWLETCSYQGGNSIERYRRALRVTVHEAATGSIIGDFILQGELPQPCPFSVTTSGNSSGTDESIGEIPSIYATMLKNLADIGFEISK